MRFRRLAVCALFVLLSAACGGGDLGVFGTPPPPSTTPDSEIAHSTGTPSPSRDARSSTTTVPGPPDEAQEANVAAVTDGDTIVIRGIDTGEIDSRTGGRKARLIGVDTPEVFNGSQCFGAQASEFTKRHLENTQVLVDFDVERTDRYGRALVYVWQTDAGRSFFNARLASEGYAQQLTVPPNVRFAELFTTLVREAREGGRGLWSTCEPTPDGPVPAPDVGFGDKDCADFSSHEEAQRFYVSEGGPASDPHGLDGDRDGFACETLPSERGPVASVAPRTAPPTAAPSSQGDCHPSYPSVCIPPAPPDLDCGQVAYRDFTVRHDVPDPDPHGFDGDRDAVGCES